jgi:DNA mismatch repair protein MutS2
MVKKMHNMHEIFEKLEFARVQARISRYSVSQLGKEMVGKIQVFENLEDATIELTKVSEFKRLLEEDGSFPMEGLTDIREALGRASIEGNFIAPLELVSIANFLKASRNAKVYFSKRGDRYPLLGNLVEPLLIDKVLEYNIERAIDDHGNIRDAASKTLKDIRQELISLSDHLRKKLEAILKAISEKDYAQEDIITQRDGRMVVPVKAEHKRHIPGFVHSASATGATVFIEPAETLETNNEISNLHFQERREIERILRELTSQVREQIDAIRESVAVLGKIDFLHAKAKYSMELIGVQPVVKKERPLRIIDGRHPILLQKHRRDEVVPLSVELGGDHRTLIITGPNAGGKSVALKTIGLLSLMVHCGIHIPASQDSEFVFLKQIFVDIGDDQSIENDLSTFSSHVINLKKILEYADEGSLVLIDEIGAGTDPVQGGALGASVLEHLTRAGAMTVATTHHGSLKAFAYETEGVENGSMEFNVETLTPTYRFQVGLPGSSYTLEIADRLGLPNNIIKRSRAFAGTQTNRLEDLIIELESLSQEYQRKSSLLEAEKIHADDLMKSYEEKINALAKDVRLMKQRAVEEASNILASANARIEQAIKEIKESQADKKAIKDARNTIDTLKKDIREVQRGIDSASSTELGETFSIGDRVTMNGSSECGEVVSSIDSIGEVLVAFKNMKMRVSVRDLVKFEERYAPEVSSFISNRDAFGKSR